ncbi:MAG TPA: hypothetical protein VN541_17945, partial [Tepidisphaeraceae bacterium]|nr:hypothetical protein [Tepidisphaeraceae bacterium]
LANKINPSNQDTLGAEWDRLDNLAHSAEYGQNVIAYSLALSLPKSERGSLVDGTIKYLSQFDTPDSQAQARVRLLIAKLNMLVGNDDQAISIFQSVADNPNKEIQPAPTLDQQYEARYFSNVAQLEAGHVKEARDGLEKLIEWEKTAMPQDAATQQGIAAAAQMLRYRVLLAQANQERDPVAKKNTEAEATNVLLKLSNDRPDLRPVIYQQLVERMPKDAPVKGMDPLLLQGIMAKAYSEAVKPPGTPMDKQVLGRGIEADAEVLRRRGAPGVTPQMLDEAQRLTPVLMEAMGSKIEAANEYLNYAQKNATLRQQAALGALEDAGRLTFELHKLNPEDPQVSALYDRFLPIAIAPPFDKKSLAFLYAQRLRLENKPEQAIKYFRMVPAGDKSYSSAQFYLMISLQDMLANPKLPAPQRAVFGNELIQQAAAVRKAYAGQTDVASRERAAIATLTGAKSAGADLHKPQETLKLLEGFEESVAGTPDEKALVGDALLTRVNAYMAMNKLKDATGTLLALLNSTGGSQGADYVRGLLDRLDRDLDKAQAAHDVKAARDIARNEADLSGFLVEWARNNSVPEIKKYTYRYMVFDARTKRLAGTLETDPAERKKLLEDAANAYKRLLEPQNLALYKATLDQKKVASGDINPDQPDPNVQLGIALTDYELADYKDAADLLGNLLNSGMLGGPTLLTQDGASNESKVTDNDVYWEATYKLYRSNVALSKEPGGPSLDPTRQGLKNLLVRGGIPAKWQESFEELRKEIAPDFNVADLNAPTATQPVSRR